MYNINNKYIENDLDSNINKKEYIIDNDNSVHSHETNHLYTRSEIKTMNMADGKRYQNYLKENKEAMDSLKNLYGSVNNIHSHLISGPDRDTLNKIIKELEKQERVLGKNLTDKEIAKITKKEMNRE